MQRKIRRILANGGHKRMSQPREANYCGRLRIRRHTSSFRAHQSIQRSSLLSASGFMVGHFRQDYELRNRGLELYHESIKLMSQALTPSRLARHSTGLFDLLMAGYLLEAFEVSGMSMLRNQRSLL